MKRQWERYKKNNFYAKEIKYEDLIESLKQVGKLLLIKRKQKIFRI